MIRRDLPEVLDIEAEGFEFPWTEEDFIRALRQRNVIGMVAERDDAVVGFMVYELHKTRLHLLNVAVARRCRREMVGRQMLAKLQGKLSQQKRTRIITEVRETNMAAQHFFAAAGFRAVNVLREFYVDTPEDAYVFQYRHPERAASPTDDGNGDGNGLLDRAALAGDRGGSGLRGGRGTCDREADADAGG